LLQGFKKTNESCYISRHKLSVSTPIQILITKDISQYLKNQISCHESIQQALSTKLKY